MAVSSIISYTACADLLISAKYQLYENTLHGVNNAYANLNNAMLIIETLHGTKIEKAAESISAAIKSIEEKELEAALEQLQKAITIITNFTIN